MNFVSEHLRKDLGMKQETQWQTWAIGIGWNARLLCVCLCGVCNTCVCTHGIC